jgi:rSAM/selenodomain-associated transferase 1
MTRPFSSLRPGARGDIASWLGEALPLLEQEGDDLGERQSKALDYAFRNGYERAVIIGTDCVTLKRSDIERALSALDEVDLVLGPSEDGGYYLVGARAPLPQVFQRIDWGTERVLGQTLKRACAAGINYVLLEPRQDIDNWADAMQVFSGMDGKVESRDARRTMEVLESLSRRKA